MANVDFGRFSQRIVQYIWDPEPTNDTASSAPIWCLGKQYSSLAKARLIEDGCTPPHEDKFEMIGPQHLAQAVTPPDSTASSIDSTQISYESAAGGQDGGWPSSFLDDFEARIWLTYRSNFPAIAKSQDPKALSSMSFKVRLSQLVDPGGFTSDTGWGCMIRSGQSLLANTLVMLQLGRGLPIF
jgi:cysteine protease ATG4